MARKIETREQREDRLLHQSFLDDVIVTPLTRTGRYAMRSAATPRGVVYVATAQSCTCPWGEEHQTDGQRCKHQVRAALENEFRTWSGTVDLDADGRTIRALKAS